ncbi:MAG: HAMP domain-containing protein [Thiothrix sp.]|nr:MAG: HAMP domain-containing protein [Thiothrix sp.]
MKMTIFSKLLLTILTTAFVVILFMMLFMNWSFRTGFADYQDRNDLERANRLVERLEELWEEQGNWDSLRMDRRNWSLLLAEIGEGRFARRAERLNEEHRGRGRQDNNQPPPPNQSLAGRLRLLANNGDLIMGFPALRPEDKVTDLAIRVEQQTVGWLQVIQRPVINDQVAETFRKQQAHNAYLIALFAVGLSVLMALLAARQFVRPVKRLMQGAKTLSEGHYSMQIPVSSSDELGDLAQRFNQLAESLQRHQEQRAQWIADISHELRTPLAVLRSEIEAIQDGIRSPTPERIRSLHAEVLSLGKLVDDLHQLSMSDAGDLETSELEIIDINEVMQDVLQTSGTRLASKGLKLESQLQVQPLFIQADYKSLRQVFGNLLENSYRYTDAPGHVVVASQQKGNKVVVIVQDSSPGVPDTALPRLFDRLFRVDKSRSRALGGSGLGLSICKNIVEGLGGQIDAQHSPLGGLAVYVEFPLVDVKA